MRASTDELKKALADWYGIESLDLLELRVGADPHSRNFQAADADGRHYFLKQRSTGSPGLRLSSWLFESGVGEVLAPIKTLSGDHAAPFGSGVLILYPYVAGGNAMESPLALGQWEELGRAVRRIHDSEPPDQVVEGVRSEDFQVEGFDSWRSRIKVGPAEDDVEQALFRVIEARMRDIERLQEQTSGFFAVRPELVPCHADMHAYNLLASADGIRIIDWDTPRFAPRECDLQFVCGGGIFGAHGAEEEGAFFRGYGLYDPDAALLRFYRAARVLEDVVAYTSEALDVGVELERRWDAVRGLERCFG